MRLTQRKTVARVALFGVLAAVALLSAGTAMAVPGTLPIPTHTQAAIIASQKSAQCLVYYNYNHVGRGSMRPKAGARHIHCKENVEGLPVPVSLFVGRTGSGTLTADVGFVLLVDSGAKSDLSDLKAVWIRARFSLETRRRIASWRTTMCDFGASVCEQMRRELDADPEGKRL